MGTSLLHFDPASLEPGLLAHSLDVCGLEPRKFEVAHGSLVVQLWLVRLGAGFALLGAPDLMVNRCGIHGVWPLNHGDVVSVGPVHLLVFEAGEELWLPESLEAEVLRTGASNEALAVAFDALRAAGHPGRPLGQLKTLKGRGLEVAWEQGFAAQLELRLSEPMFWAWRRRWFRLLGSTPALRFTRTLSLVEGLNRSPVDLELATVDLAARLGASFPQLQRLCLSPGFADVGELAVQALSGLLNVRVEIHHHAEPVPETYTNEWSEPSPLKLFPPPPPSSWFNQGGPE